MSLTREQLALRRLRVGSSEVGALVDYYAPREDRVDPYKTVHSLFREKVLPADEAPVEDHRTWGLDVEPAIIRNHFRREGLRPLAAPGTIVHPHAALCATPDALGLTREERVRDVQVKNAQRHQAHHWGEAGSDTAPLLYVAQVTVELGILRTDPRYREHLEDTGDLAVSLEGAPPVAYRIKFDEELFLGLCELADRFRREHLDTGRPPPFDGRDDAAEYIRRRFPRETGPMLPYSPEAETLAREAVMWTHTAAEAKRESERARQSLKALIGEAAGIEGLATWKRCKDTIKTVTDWEAVARALRDGTPWDAALAAHTAKKVVKQGGRRLRLLIGDAAEDTAHEEG